MRTAFTRGQCEVASAVLSEPVALMSSSLRQLFFPQDYSARALPEVAAVHGTEAQGFCSALPPRILSQESAASQLCDPGKI